MTDKKPLIIITGPTAVGKTDASVMLALRINGSIISADSMQIYKYMNIGTAKVTPEEMQGVKHYLIDELYPDEEFNVTVFQKLAKEAINDCYANGKIPIIAGGTGFYVQSVLYDIKFDDNEEDPALRKKWEDFYEKNGTEALFEELKKVDPEYTECVHANNTRKVIRALAFYELTGTKLSKHNSLQHENESPYDFRYFVLTRDRDVLYDRINRRVDLMFENGLVEEVKRILEKGYSKDLISMQGIGYKEVIDYLEGNIALDECMEIIKLNTRHFAKRQLTWFKREKTVEYIDADGLDNLQITDILEKSIRK